MRWGVDASTHDVAPPRRRWPPCAHVAAGAALRGAGGRAAGPRAESIAAISRARRMPSGADDVQRSTADTLDPRPETEALIAAGARPRPSPASSTSARERACILLSLAWRETGGDGHRARTCPRPPSPWPARNAAHPGARGPRCDVPARRLVGGHRAARFDLIVSNPPYIAAAEMARPRPRGARPRAALGADRRCRRASVPTARSWRRAGAHLAPGGRLMVEIGPDAGRGRRRHGARGGRAGPSPGARIVADLDGRDRVRRICGVTRRRRGGFAATRGMLAACGSSAPAPKHGSTAQAARIRAPRLHPLPDHRRDHTAPNGSAQRPSSRLTVRASAPQSAAPPPLTQPDRTSYMRSSKSRSRGNKNRNNRPSGGNIINRVTFDSSGPEGKVRGTPQQIIDKYGQMHRDALLSNDRVNAENFAQHAEHYLRMLAEAQGEVDKPARASRTSRTASARPSATASMQADRDRQAERDREREARPSERRGRQREAKRQRRGQFRRRRPPRAQAPRATATDQGRPRRPRRQAGQDGAPQGNTDGRPVRGRRASAAARARQSGPRPREERPSARAGRGVQRARRRRCSSTAPREADQPGDRTAPTSSTRPKTSAQARPRAPHPQGPARPRPTRRPAARLRRASEAAE